MKTSDLTLWFLCLMIPLFLLLQWRDEDTTTNKRLSLQYDKAITAAVQDSVHTLRLNSDPDLESGYGSFKFNRVNREEALSSFFETLSFNFGAEDIVAKDILERYVPAIGVVDYDGLHLSVYKTYKDEGGHKAWKRVWLPKIPYSYEDGEGNVISFRLDDTVRVFDASNKKWLEGPRKEVAPYISIPLLTDEQTFDSVRRTAIINTLQENLAFYINEHNTYARHLGIDYTFALPVIPAEDWNNTVNDISVFGFLQGIPIERGYTYNNYSFGGSRLMKVKYLYGSTVNGKRIYYREDCGYNYPVDELFTDPKQAASKGYRYLACPR